MDKELVKQQKAAHQAEDTVIRDAMQVAAEIGLEVEWDQEECPSCCKGLAEVILEFRDKGKIFHQLSMMTGDESKFRNCGRELRGFATYHGRTYAVNEETGHVELAIVNEETGNVDFIAKPKSKVYLIYC